MLESLEPETRDWVTAVSILVAFWIPALLLRLLWRQILSPWIRRSSNPNLALLLRPLRGLASWLLVMIGINVAYQNLEFAKSRPTLSVWIQKSIAVVGVLMAIFFLVRLTAGFFQYQARRSVVADQEYHERTSTGQKLTTGAIIVIGALFILRIAGIDISPFLAGGAVGGIIIGLALQDSLSNVFAGLFLNMDRPIQVGDLLKLDQDREGFVEEVGWRYTKVRLWNDSLLVIPNNKFGQSAFVNFNRPVSALNVHVECGVAYDSDLDHVERTAIEAARAAQDEVNGRETPFEPYVRWRAFSGSAIMFRVFMRVDQPTAQYRAISACIKQIHHRFQEAAIVIPYPTQAVIHMDPPDANRI